VPCGCAVLAPVALSLDLSAPRCFVRAPRNGLLCPPPPPPSPPVPTPPCAPVSGVGPGVLGGAQGGPHSSGRPGGVPSACPGALLMCRLRRPARQGLQGQARAPGRAPVPHRQHCGADVLLGRHQPRGVLEGAWSGGYHHTPSYHLPPSPPPLPPNPSSPGVRGPCPCALATRQSHAGARGVLARVGARSLVNTTRCVLCSGPRLFSAVPRRGSTCWPCAPWASFYTWACPGQSLPWCVQCCWWPLRRWVVEEGPGSRGGALTPPPCRVPAPLCWAPACAGCRGRGARCHPPLQ
jgi:hypothetical protein